VLLTAPAAIGRPPAVRLPARGRRMANRTLAAIGAAAAAVVLVAVPGVARADAAGGFTDATNQARVAAGLAPLTVSANLVAAATAHAHEMASSGILAHTAQLGSALCCWQIVGENVGKGPSEAVIQAALMHSSEHRANILGDYTQVGIGYAVDSHGTVWVSELFLLPNGKSAVVQAKAAVTKPVTHTTAPARKAVVQPSATIVPPPIAAAAAVVQLPTVTAASRDLTRVPLDAAQRFAAQLTDSHVITGTNPVSRLLEFAAQAAASR
jgi:uncharacterized protein YkwD